MPSENQKQMKDVSIQRIVDLIGNYIVKDEIPNCNSVTKSFGEVEIKNTMYQIQITLVPGKNNWKSENGVTTQKTKSWIRLKISNLFSSTTDAGTQK